MTSQTPWTWGITWNRDGTSVIYGALIANVPSLWRVRADGGTAPERIEGAGVGAAWPAVASVGDRLAFSRDLNASIPYRFDSGRPSRPLLTSTLFDGNLDFSPDGQRITYQAKSAAADVEEVWTAAADGSRPQQLTHGPGRYQGSPHWSPDGQHVAFDSWGADGSWHIWTIAADGGVPRQVTTDQGSQNAHVVTGRRMDLLLVGSEQEPRYLAHSLLWPTDESSG